MQLIFLMFYATPEYCGTMAAKSFFFYVQVEQLLHGCILLRYKNILMTEYNQLSPNLKPL